MGAGANALRVIVGLKPKIPIDEQLRNACFFGQADVVEQILLTIPHGPGGPVDGEDPIGYTPIMYAAGSGYPQILEMLLQHGATMNHVAQNGYTALHKAAEGGKIACLNVLLVWRADMNIQSAEGYTPAMCAVIEKKDIFLKRLIEAKCDLTLRDKRGNLAIDLVKHGGTIEILEEGMQIRTGLEEQRRSILVEKRMLLQQKLKETREKEEAEKRAKLAREESALKLSTERALQEMAEQAKRDNEAFQRSLLEQQEHERKEAEAKRAREAEIQRTRSEGAAQRRIRIPTLAAFLSLQNHYVLSKLLDCSKKLDARTAVLNDDDSILVTMRSLTDRKKELAEELVLLNVVPIVPTEFTSVGRWGGTLAQVDWLIKQATLDWKELQAGSKAYVDESQSETLNELHAMKLFFSADADSEARKKKQERELEMQREEREKKFQEEREKEKEENDRARAQELLIQAQEDKIRGERSLEEMRLSAATQLGLAAPFMAAFLTVCNSYCLHRIMALSKLMNGAGPDSENYVSSQVLLDDGALKELQALATIKKSLGQLLLTLKLGALVPSQFSEIDMRCRKSSSGGGKGDDVGAAMAIEEQTSWLASKIRLESESGSGDGMGIGSEEEKHEGGVTQNETCKQVVDGLSSLLQLDGDSSASVAGKGAVSIHAVGTLAWRRDQAMHVLTRIRVKLVDFANPGETSASKSESLLQRLEQRKSNMILSQPSFRQSERITQQEEEDRARIAYFENKVTAEKEKLEAEKRKEEEEIRQAEATHEAETQAVAAAAALKAEAYKGMVDASLADFQAIIGTRKAPAAGGKRGVADKNSDVANSLAKFREATLGL